MHLRILSLNRHTLTSPTELFLSSVESWCFHSENTSLRNDVYITPVYTLAKFFRKKGEKLTEVEKGMTHGMLIIPNGLITCKNSSPRILPVVNRIKKVSLVAVNHPARFSDRYQHRACPTTFITSNSLREDFNLMTS